MEEERKDFERLLNIKPEESFELDALNYAFDTFRTINDNIDQLISSSNFDNIIDKILGMKFNYRKGLKYSLAEFILNGIEDIVGPVRGVPTRYEVDYCEGSKFVLGLILRILKEKNMVEQAKSFILSLVCEINERASVRRDKLYNPKSLGYGSVTEQTHRLYEGNKVSIRTILQALSDRNMVECEELFIDKLDSTVKMEMEDVFPKNDTEINKSENLGDSAKIIGENDNESPRLTIYTKDNIEPTQLSSEELEATNVCKLLEYAYINQYDFIIWSLLKNGNLLNAMKESGHFCYYVCMLPTKEYESVKQDFSNFERFKIWLYRLAWRFFSPKIKINVKPLSIKSSKNQVFSDTVKNNLECREMQNTMENKNDKESNEI